MLSNTVHFLASNMLFRNMTNPRHAVRHEGYGSVIEIGRSLTESKSRVVSDRLLAGTFFLHQLDLVKLS